LRPRTHHDLWRHQLRAPLPVTSRRPATVTPALRSRYNPPLLPLSAANFEGGDAARGDGNPTNNNNSNSKPRGDKEAEEGKNVRAETQRLMSVPTIDIKLELQMRGVDHRDAFEKVDLARRLAELRTSSSSSSSSYFDGVGQAAKTAASDAANGGGGGGGGGGSGGGGGTSSSSPSASTPASVSPFSSAHGEEPPAGGGRSGGGGEVETEEEDAVYARDVSKAERMGKKAVTRELNAMGVAHSRLSDVSVLARQYASGRLGAREGAAEARPQGAPGGTYSGGDGGGQWQGQGRGEEGKGEGKSKGEGKGEGGERWTPIGRWGRATSRLPWNAGKKRDGNDDDDIDGDDYAGSSTDWSTRGNAGDEDEGGDAGSSSDWSTRGNAGTDGERFSADAGERSRRVSLHARADRMSSRELMNALDDLGARYRIPVHRSKLQQAFVSAALA
ncbi:unnamed protein product, partial [Laminaria digitata]